jgi:hypothetical protein
MILAIIGISVSLLLGYFATSLLWPPQLTRTPAALVALPVGIGLCSFIYIIFRRPVFVVEGSLLVIMGMVWLVFAPPPNLSFQSVARWRPPAAYLVLACALGMAISYWMIRIERSPYGDGDAVSNWNSHARYLYRDGPSWRKDILNTFHADYPLLTASTTARLWRYMGREIPDVGGFLGMLYTLAAIGVLTSTIAHFRGTSRAVVFGLTLLGTPFYADYGVSQSADVPLSLYILVTIALICFQSEAGPDRIGLLVLAGFTAGCAGWTKNEGLVFIIATSAALLAPMFWEPVLTIRRYLAFAAGLAVPISVILWFKLTVAPPSDIFGNAHYHDVVERLANPDRYLTIWLHVSDAFWSFGQWMIHPIWLLLGYVGLQGIDRKMLLNVAWLQGAAICVLVLAGYFAVFALSPFDLQWYLDSSLPRLCLHLWPAFLLQSALIARSNS